MTPAVVVGGNGSDWRGQDPGSRAPDAFVSLRRDTRVGGTGETVVTDGVEVVTSVTSFSTDRLTEVLVELEPHATST